MKTKFPILLIIAAAIFYTCKKTPGDQVKPPASSDKELLEFKLEDSLNGPYLIETITGKIVGNEIQLAINEVVDMTKLVATFDFKGVAVYVGPTMQESKITINDFSQQVTYSVEAEDGSRIDYVVKVELLPELKSAVPHIYIDTDNEAPVNSKTDYVNADIRIDGGGEYDDYEGRTSIRGRGNSTWGYPKKPYRLKLDKKAPLLGLSSEKDWILLANYLDESLMCNAVAMKIGRLLEMPFTHHIIPVDVTMNGVYVGNYMFTEHKEVEDNRINIGDDGILLELDTYFDEPYKFMSKDYQLPVMIQFPELDKLPSAEASAGLNSIKSDFELVTGAIAGTSFPDNNYLDLFDAKAFVDYMIVYTLTLNEEINHPKSTYIYKKKGGKYSMGPIWDFDWGFGYEGTSQHFIGSTRPLFWTGGKAGKGTVFFSRLMSDPAIQSLFKQEWNSFKTTKYPKLVKYVQDYAGIIKNSYHNDYLVWRRGTDNLDGDLQRLLTWLDERVTYIDGLVAGY